MYCQEEAFCMSSFSKSFIASITPKTLIFLILISFSCNNVSRREQAERLFLVKQSDIYYDLNKPSDKYFLPYVLSEISGLTMTPEGQLLTIEDETGKVFVYDLDKKDIDYGITFAKSGDYEGIEIVNGMVYVLRSDGDLYEFEFTKKKKVDARKIETPLGKDNDTEGLGYYPRKNQLFIACKEEGGIDKKTKHKTVYAFDLDSREFKEEPKLEVSNKDLKEFLEKHIEFEYDVERLKFEPSAVAWHPIHERFYLLASVGKLLVVLTEDGEIESTYPISPQILNQPEGICFSPEGDMYISSEGEGDKGFILKFPMLTK